LVWSKSRFAGVSLEAEKQVLILAGGGGHTGFAYALAQRLSGKAMLSFLAPEDEQLGFQRLSSFGKVVPLVKGRGAKTNTSRFTVNFAKALANSMKKVEGGLDVVVSTGSNFCIPPSLVAFLKGIPLVNIESEARFVAPSKTARVLQPFSAVTALQWPEQKSFLKGTVVGPLFPEPEVEPYSGGYILVTGGTLGYKRLFDVLSETNLENVVLQTGKVDPEPYKKAHPTWKVIDYSLQFAELVAGAEVVVTHQGSTPLQAATYKKPAVIIPDPELKRTFPKKDSELFAKKVGAVFLSELSLDLLVDAIEQAKHRKTPLLPDGAKVLADLILNL
jgi:UDP-N-acetylglucosamine:LPS N-acetylglucosamine transferase